VQRVVGSGEVQVVAGRKANLKGKQSNKKEAKGVTLG
jgi:hypothetical protein